MSYAQDNEDAWALRHFCPDYRGRFLDLGAHDGQRGSNTLLLAEHGWSGVLVDASPQTCKRLCQTASRFPGVEVVHAVIGMTPGLVPFWCVFDDGLSSLSTTSKPLQDRGLERTGAHKFWANALTIPDLLTAHPGPYDVVSIDLEGISLDVMRAIPWDDIKCRFAVIEAFPSAVLGQDERPTVQAYMESRGFRLLAHSLENVILGR